jgi:predicted GIY-YIG superfamily endonuclease
VTLVPPQPGPGEAEPPDTERPRLASNKEAWLKLVLALRISDLGLPISPALLKGLAARLAVQADEDGRGQYPPFPILAAEFEVPPLEIVGCLHHLHKLGLLLCGDGRAALDHPDLRVPHDSYQLAARMSLFRHPAYRGAEGILLQAEAIQREVAILFSDPNPGPTPLPRTALYRWYDSDDRLLYVGISSSLASRQANHFKGSTWASFAHRSTVTWFDLRADAERAERGAIVEESPLFNHVHNDTPEARQRLVAYLVEKNRLDLLAPAVSRG